jgi:hypothetical protein
MDDNYRLLKLLSLVVWTYEGCGLRLQNEVDQVLLDEETATALHSMCERYAGAVKNYATDVKELPVVTLGAVTNLPSDVINLLGGMVKDSLGLWERAHAPALGRLWLEDVTAAAWRLVLVNEKELWGTDFDQSAAERYPSWPPLTP